MHGLKLSLDLVTMVKWYHLITIGLNALGMARHHHPHKFFCSGVGIIAFYEDFFYFPIVKIADCSFD